MKNLLIAALLCFGCNISAQITPSNLSNGENWNGYLANYPGLTYNVAPVIDMSAYIGSRVSAQVIYSSSTFSKVTFSTANYSLGGSVISSSSGWTLALPVLYAIGSSPAISGLVTGTTYYAIPTAVSVQLSATSTGAIAGSYINLTSTTTSTNSYTLTPLAIAGTPSIAWQSSNDGVNFAASLSTGTVNMTTDNNTTPTELLFDFGFYNFRYLRANVTAPTQGGLLLQIPVNIKEDGIGSF
jgi:hypothetical protein